MYRQKNSMQIVDFSKIQKSKRSNNANMYKSQLPHLDSTSLQISTKNTVDRANHLSNELSNMKHKLASTFHKVILSQCL